MKVSFVTILCSLLLLTTPAYAQSGHRCSKDALAQAQKLLEFHFGPDNRIEIDKKIKVLAPIRNPAATNQQFDVLEAWGFVYKGQYRMRFIYAQMPGECVLMGQEILEHARL
jgi:hypothetical protein